MKSWFAFGLIASAFAGLFSRATLAYTVTPSLLTMRPLGDESSAFLHLENKDTKAAAIEITIQEHHKDLDGQPVAGRDAESEFLIYPAQLVMLPGDEVAAQVRWIGEPAVTTERVYTLVTREVPIPRKATDEPGRQEGVRIAIDVQINYEVRLYVTPKGAKPRVSIESVTDRPSATEPGAQAATPSFEILLVNKGAAHEVLVTKSLVFTPLDDQGAPRRQEAVTVSGKNISAMKPHLLAGDRRRVVVPRPAGMPAGPVRVTLSD